jgi:hypothetical protein
MPDVMHENSQYANNRAELVKLSIPKFLSEPVPLQWRLVYPDTTKVQGTTCHVIYSSNSAGVGPGLRFLCKSYL